MRTIETAINNADSFWWEAARDALKYLADTGEPFTADDLRSDPISVPEPDSPARWGALFFAARREGIITPCGWATSLTASRRYGSHRVWIGTDTAVTDGAV